MSDEESNTKAFNCSILWRKTSIRVKKILDLHWLLVRIKGLIFAYQQSHHRTRNPWATSLIWEVSSMTARKGNMGNCHPRKPMSTEAYSVNSNAHSTPVRIYGESYAHKFCAVVNITRCRVQSSVRAWFHVSAILIFIKCLSANRNRLFYMSGNLLKT